MGELSAHFDAPAIEAAARALWAARSLPPSPGTIGPPGGPVTRQLLGTFGVPEAPLDRLVRAVNADVAARYLAMTGRRAVGLVPEGNAQSPDPAGADRATFATVAAWTAAGVALAYDAPQEAAHLQLMVENLAKAGLLAARGFPFRSCPSCRTPRTPETIVYQSERGPAFLFRFPLREAVQPTSLIVWADNPWKLLATSAVLVSPDLTYVTAVYRRRGVVERIVVAKSAIARLKQWLPGCEIEVLEERGGAEWVGAGYVHPLLTECPPVGQFPPPAGTVLASPDVGDSGTGIVGLAPRHGAADSHAAASLRVDGPVVVTTAGAIRTEPRHKYSGLPLEAADSFVLRDLKESGLVFAELTVQRGVPHCTLCGSGLIWLPGRAWCLEIARLPAPLEREFARLLPDDALPAARDVVPWPLSETLESQRTTSPTLLECDACDRLQVPSFTGPCPCGSSSLHATRRDLLPAFAAALAAWAEIGPSEAAQLFVPDRRRVPTVLHQLVAREASGVRPGELRLVRLPSMAEDAEAERLIQGGCADALRAALVRATSRTHRAAHLADRYRQEARRLRKLWQLSRVVLDIMAEDSLTFDPEYPISHLSELADEDRALLSRFERARNDVRLQFESLDLAGALDRLAAFMEQDVSAGYLPLARTRLHPATSPTARAPTWHVLARVVYLWVELFAAFAPFTADAIAQGFRPDSPALVERTLTPVTDALVDSAREKEFDRWVDFAGALRSARRQVGLAADAILPRVVLLVADDALAAELERAAPVLARVGRTGQIEIDSPNHAWAGRRIEARAVPAEIQRVYGARAGRILHLLERFPGRKAMEGMRNGNLNVVLDGQTVKILPGMIEFMESLPECVVPVPWRDGEILLVDPTENAAGSLPSLSLDGLGVVRHVRRRLRRADGRPPPERILAAADGALAGELEHHAAAIAEHLKVGRFQVVGDEVRFPPAERSTGRTRRGDRWAIWIPGLPVGGARSKQPRARPRGPRVRRAPPPPERPIAEVDEEERQRSEAIRTLVDQFTSDFGRPFMGPAKTAAAWDAGLRTIQDFHDAPFETIAKLPGFGYQVAVEFAHRYGGTIPPRPPRATPRRPPPVRRGTPPLPAVATPAIPASTAGIAEPTPTPPPVERPVPAARAQPTEIPSPSPPGPEGPSTSTLSPAPRDRPLRAVPRVQPPKMQFITSPRRIAPPTLTPLAPLPEPSPIAPAPVGPPVPPPADAIPPSAAPPPRRDPPRPSPFTPQPVPEVAAPPPKPTGVEIWKGMDAEGAWGAFLEATRGDVRGVCITREPPGARRSSLGGRTVQVVWLSNIPLGPANPTARPGDLDGIEFGLRSEIVDHNTKAVFLESLEYLVTIHGVARIAAFLAKVDEFARENGAQVLVPLRSGLMDPTDLQTISGNFRGPSTAVGGPSGA
ncbi:MAG TPA: DUF835 domain-containing protein [Thermoplasmata archaeon]|nr:DUF835 domain-containing protein [Thermoplasmata archaeon]